MRLSDLVRTCETLVPASLADEGDPVGLHVGDPNAIVSRVLLSLDATEATLNEAKEWGAECLLVHHPLLFRPTQSLRLDRPEGRLLAECVRHGLAVFVMHTNLDVACPGTSDALAEVLGIQETHPLVPLERPVGEPLFKLVVFVPSTAAERVRMAMGDAGAGRIGNYSHCSFSTLGTGSFRPLEGAHPTIGSLGAQEKVTEERVEVVVPPSLVAKVIRAMREAHPYEEVAYDLYPLASPPSGAGLGRVGTLASPCSLQQLAHLTRERLAAPVVAVVGDPRRSIRCVAVCGGSGGHLVEAAVAAGADVLITGEVKHHQALLARDCGLAVIDAGHTATERPVLDLLLHLLGDALPSEVSLRISSTHANTVWSP